jgi:hypothetical protein
MKLAMLSGDRRRGTRKKYFTIDAAFDDGETLGPYKSGKNEAPTGETDRRLM